MSKRRFSAGGGAVNPNKLPRGPNGRACCRQCGREVPPSRKTFCGADCVHRWKLTRDSAYVRRLLIARDHGICAACGANTEVIRKELNRVCNAAGPEEATRQALLLGFKCKFTQVRRWGGYWKVSRSLWEADHIVEVRDGGGECDLSNMQTLCVNCHRVKTAARSSSRPAREESPR